MKTLSAFLMGAVAGGVAALLLTPKTGADMREEVRQILIRKGIIKDVSEDEIIDQIVAEIEASNK